MMSIARRVLVLALDAASPDLIRTGIEDGTLPNLAALAGDGLSAATRSVEGLFVGATWPSFYTGHDPAGHGIYWTDRIRPGSYRVQRASDRDFARQPALWEVLASAGKDVIVLDVPLSRRSPRLNGVQVIEWGVHDVTFGFQTTPASLGRSIMARYGSHPAPTVCDAPYRSPSEYVEFASSLVRGARLRAKLTLDLLESYPWQFAIQVFSETHCAGHQLWHFHDARHPGFDPDVTAAHGDLVRQVYQAVDTAVGEIIAGIGDDVTVLLLGLHGMAHCCGASILLPDILENLGALFPADAQALTPVESASPARRLARLYHRLPKGIRSPIYNARQYLNQRWLRRGTPLPFDTTRSRAFYVGLGEGAQFSGIRLNIKDREPAGVLDPGAEVRRFCAELTEDLLAVVDPETGLPLVTDVLRSADLFHGPYSHELPDLLVRWNTEPPRGSRIAGNGAGAVWRGRSPKFGDIERTNDYCRTGEHRREGFLIARGDGISPGRLERTIDNLDLAPTIAAWLRVPTPSMPGKPVPEIA